MLYLLDANVLIDANRDYYPLERFPEFWDWLLHMGEQGKVKLPRDQHEEIRKGTKDSISIWAKRPEVKAALVLEEEADVSLTRKVVEEGYAPNLTDDEVERLGRDPFLIAHALLDPPNRCVVTTEVSKPKKQRANKKVPDVCEELGVSAINTFDFVKELDFATNWRDGI